MLVGQGRYFLYRHIRLDKNEPFYIGIGSKRKRPFNSFETEYERAYSTYKRNKYWDRVFAKTLIEVEIVLESNDLNFIKEKEKEFIYFYRNKGIRLTNMTDGGGGYFRVSSVE